MDIWPALEALGTVGAAGIAAFATVRANRIADRSDSAAARSNAAAETMAEIERGRQYRELTPRLRVTITGSNPGVDDLTMHVELVGPPALVQLDKLTVTIRDDHHRRGDSLTLPAGNDGPTRDDIKRHIWGPYMLRPQVGPHNARADITGRTVVYEDPLPVGEELPFPLEPTRPARWMHGTTPDMWRKERGSTIRVLFLAEHNTYGIWRLPAKIDVFRLVGIDVHEIVVDVPQV